MLEGISKLHAVAGSIGKAIHKHTKEEHILYGEELLRKIMKSGKARQVLIMEYEFETDEELEGLLTEFKYCR